jgi:hypothetical protein
MHQDLARLVPGRDLAEVTSSTRACASGLSATQVDRAIPSTLSFDQSLLVVRPQVVVLTR